MAIRMTEIETADENYLGAWQSKDGKVTVYLTDNGTEVHLNDFPKFSPLDGESLEFAHIPQDEELNDSSPT